MAVIPGLEWTFNTVAEHYDKWSPGYPKELYADIFAYLPLDENSRALEIGIGTGQATKPVLDTGCALTAVELGDNLAALAREKFKAYKRFTVVNLPFQDFSCEDGTFDLIYSARAFHWIPEELGYTRVFAMLRGGGAFARFASHSYYVKREEALNSDIQAVYAEYMPASKLSPEYTERDAQNRSSIAVKYGFTQEDYKLYYRERTYSARDYISLIGIYSDHITLDESVKPAFFDGIRRAIEKHGGSITLRDTIELNLARKPLTVEAKRFD